MFITSWANREQSVRYIVQDTRQFLFSVSKKNQRGTEEMAQQLAAHAALPADLNCVSNTHDKQLTCNSSYKACDVLLRAL